MKKKSQVLEHMRIEVSFQFSSNTSTPKDTRDSLLEQFSRGRLSHTDEIFL